MAVAAQTYTVIWSPSATRTFDSIVSYIEDRFSTSAAQKFVSRTISIVSIIADRPTLFRKSEKGRNKHIVVVTKQTVLYYRVHHRRKQVELLLFWDTRQNPSNIKY